MIPPPNSYNQVLVVYQLGKVRVLVKGFFTFGGLAVRNTAVSSNGSVDDLNLALPADDFKAFVNVSSISGSITFTLQVKGPDGSYYPVASTPAITSPGQYILHSTVPLTQTYSLSWTVSGSATVTLTYQAII